jgi:hypothetical protein
MLAHSGVHEMSCSVRLVLAEATCGFTPVDACHTLQIREAVFVQGSDSFQFSRDSPGFMSLKNSMSVPRKTHFATPNLCGLVMVGCGLRLRRVRNGYVKRTECVSVSGIIGEGDVWIGDCRVWTETAKCEERICEEK